MFSTRDWLFFGVVFAVVVAIAFVLGGCDLLDHLRDRNGS